MSEETQNEGRHRDTEQWFQQGNHLADQEQFEEAIAAYDQTLRFDPTYTRAIHNKHFALNRLGK